MASDSNVKVLLGDPRKAIRTMALPLVISLLVAEINTVVDRVWCAGLGSDALAAISLVVPIYMVIIGLGNGLGVGSAAVVSRHIGSGDKDTVDGCAVNSLMFGLLFGMVLVPVLLLITEPMLGLIGEASINPLASSYMFYVSLFIPVFILNGVVAGLLRGEGDAKMARTMAIITALTNVVLDPILIYVLDMGVMGASLATALAFTVSTVFGISLFIRHRTFIDMSFSGFRFNRGQLSTVLHVGVPQMLEYTVMYAMNLVLNYIVIYCAGSTGLTIYSVPNILMEVAMIPALAIGSALVPVASAAYGQGDMGRISDAYRHSLRFGIGIVTAIVAVVFLLPEQFLSIFTYTEEMDSLMDPMVEALRIYCIMLPLYALIPIGSSLLQAIVMPNRSVICAVIRNILLIVLYAIAAQYSLTAIFWAVLLGEWIGGFMMYVVANRSFASIRSATVD